MGNPDDLDLSAVDEDPDDLAEVEDDPDPDPAEEDDGTGLPEGPAPEDDDWSDLGDTYDLGTAQPDDTHPTAD